MKWSLLNSLLHLYILKSLKQRNNSNSHREQRLYQMWTAPSSDTVTRSCLLDRKRAAEIRPLARSDAIWHLALSETKPIFPCSPSILTSEESLWCELTYVHVRRESTKDEAHIQRRTQCAMWNRNQVWLFRRSLSLCLWHTGHWDLPAGPAQKK